MFVTLGLGLCLGLGSGFGLGLGSALGLLLGLILLGTLSLYYCTHSIDRQQAIMKVPACSPSVSETTVKYELQQQHCEAATVLKYQEFVEKNPERTQPCSSQVIVGRHCCTLDKNRLYSTWSCS